MGNNRRIIAGDMHEYFGTEESHSFMFYFTSPVDFRLLDGQSKLHINA